MFDFFSEIIEFMSQIAHIFNWGWGYMQSVINILANHTKQFQPVLAGAPQPVPQILLFLICTLIFDFIRGRGKGS